MKSGLLFLLRNFIVFGLLYAWLFAHVAGAGNLFGAYVTILAIAALVGVFVPLGGEDLLKHRYYGRFLRTLDVIGQWAALCMLVWFGHFALAAMWAFLCTMITILRAAGMKRQKEAQLEAMTKDKDRAALTKFAERLQKMPREKRRSGVGVRKAAFTS